MDEINTRSPCSHLHRKLFVSQISSQRTAPLSKQIKIKLELGIYLGSIPHECGLLFCTLLEWCRVLRWAYEFCWRNELNDGVLRFLKRASYRPNHYQLCQICHRSLRPLSQSAHFAECIAHLRACTSQVNRAISVH